MAGCFIRISMSNLKDIHNGHELCGSRKELLYQDFNEQFEGYTQQSETGVQPHTSCFIRISMSNLKDIHNAFAVLTSAPLVALSGFQWAIWRIYTTIYYFDFALFKLLYQDFNEQFEGYTQHVFFTDLLCKCCFIRISMNNLKDIHNRGAQVREASSVVLSGFQWTK